MSAVRPVLLIRFDGMGDLVMLLATAEALARHHAPAPLVCLTRERGAEAARASGVFDEVIVERGLNGRPDGPSKVLGTAPALLRRDFAVAYAAARPTTCGFTAFCVDSLSVAARPPAFCARRPDSPPLRPEAASTLKCCASGWTASASSPP